MVIVFFLFNTHLLLKAEISALCWRNNKMSVEFDDVRNKAVKIALLWTLKQGLGNDFTPQTIEA